VNRRAFLGICLSSLGFFGIACRKKNADTEASSLIAITSIDKLSEGKNYFPIERVILIKNKDSVRALSLVCTHQECLLAAQNNGEFLCPCHGSRFSSEGRVLTGPATEDLHWLYVEISSSGEVQVDFNRLQPKPS